MPVTLERPQIDTSLLRQHWQDFIPGYSGDDVTQDFLRYVNYRVSPRLGDWDLSFCSDCNLPGLDSEDDLTTVNAGDGMACERCLSANYTQCYNCTEYVTSYNTTTVEGGRRACQPCVESDHRYCEACDVWYHDDDVDEHDHDDEEDESADCCVARNRTFTFPNGDSSVPNDERVTVTTPAGVISETGLRAMRTLLQRENGLYDVSYLISEIGDEWQTRQGNFTKRLSRAAHKKYGLKVPGDVLTQIGNLARENSGNSSDFHLEFTRNLNLSAAEFYHRDSCWWGGYSSSRCVLKTHGGIGLRSFTSDGEVSGRVWIMPVTVIDNKVTGFTDETNAEAYLIFNGYGEVNGYSAARLVATMTGKTYAKIGFTPGVMYVNGETAFLVGAADLIANYTTTEGGPRGVNVDLSKH